MSKTAEATAEPSRVPGVRFWLHGTLAAAVAITAIDAVLLQQKKSFFTGGFLTATHAANAAEAAAFIAASLVVDASVAGVFALVLVWLTSRLRITRAARLFLIFSGALAPLIIWDFIDYSLLAYLGDTFDLGLMFDLTGRNPNEIAAVASSHLIVSTTG